MRMQQRISWQCLFEVNVHSSLLPFCSSDDWAVRPSSACNSVWPPQFYCIWVALRATTRAYSRKLQQRISHHAVVHIYSSVWNVLKVLHLLSVHMHQRRRSCLWQPWMIRTCTMECTGTTLLVVILVSLMQLIWIHCLLTAFLAWAVTIKCYGVSMNQACCIPSSMISHGSWGKRYIAVQRVRWSFVTRSIQLQNILPDVWLTLPFSFFICRHYVTEGFDIWWSTAYNHTYQCGSPWHCSSSNIVLSIQIFYIYQPGKTSFLNAIDSISHQSQDQMIQIQR